MVSKKDLQQYEEYLIQKRRDFHMHPEPGFEEFRTSKIVSDELKSFGYQVIEGVGKTGVIGILSNNPDGKTIALRADMDALRMQEENDVEYKSKVDGMMHSCGHDTHTAMLLGAAKYFGENRDQINGTLKVIFQSAEEGPMPGGGIFVIEDGHLDDVDAVFGLHITSRDKVGTLSVKKGAAMAAPDEFSIDIIGTGTHASAPHTGWDPIYTASQVVVAFQSIISRNINPNTPAVISVCMIQGGTAFNIIPEKVTLKGTVRTLDPTTRDFVFKRMDEVLKSITELHKSKYVFEIIKGYPPLINDDRMVDFMTSISESILGKENVIVLDEPSMGGEDFAYYLEQKPGAFGWLGGGRLDQDEIYYNHNPKFDIDESALLNGMAIHVNTVIEYLQKK